MPVESEKLLGINLHQSLKWGEHIIANKKSMIKTLNGRLNALRRISYKASFKTRLMVGNACFLSIISYITDDRAVCRAAFLSGGGVAGAVLVIRRFP